MMIQENHVYFPSNRVILLIISAYTEYMDHGVQRKLRMIVKKFGGGTATWHVLEELLWDHQMLVEPVLMGQAYKLWVLLQLWITVVVELLVAAGINVHMAHHLMAVFLLGQNGSSMLHLLGTIKLYKHA